MENKIYDAFGNEFTSNADDFKLVQIDQKIHDQKFDTKPTTFAKDAFKRFCKNRASVVGAIIIGIIMLCSIFVPMFLKYDTTNALPYETLLRPKLFEAGTGFWDGTERITKQPFYTAEFPVNPNSFSPNCVSNINVYEEGGVKYVDFTYDKYEHLYGEKELVVTDAKLREYVDNGWIEYDFQNVDSFKVLDKEKAPVITIKEDRDGDVIAQVMQYKYFGYSSMPKHLFGTDELGHDLFKKAFLGLRKSFIFAICIATICFAFGLVWGAISGYFGGNVDLALERFKDILAGVPLVVVVTLFRLHLGDKLWVFALSLCITGWMGVAARTRTQFYRFKGREYVLASRTLGAKDSRLIFRHILPNAMGTIVTSSVLMIPQLIFTEASLSYLGLGLGGSDSFGTILSDNQKFLQTYPMLILFPAIIISLLMISFNLFGNGLRDALNPSLKGSE